MLMGFHQSKLLEIPDNEERNNALNLRSLILLLRHVVCYINRVNVFKTRLFKS